MTNEQFTQVVEAILEGKYSWACVLILRFAGYNPLHYIPYRTYNRLLKDNQLARDPKYPSQYQKQASKHHAGDRVPQPSLNLEDINHLEPIGKAKYQIRGGSCWNWLLIR